MLFYLTLYFQQWMSKNPILIENEQIKKFLNDSVFEDMINILERLTGTSKEPVNMVEVLS